MKARFLSYFRQTGQSLFNCWLENCSHPTQASLHDFRVHLKKIKLSQHFLAWVYGKSALGKLPDQINQIFKQAGSVRELQLLADWLQKEKISLEEELNCTQQNILTEQSLLQKILIDLNAPVSKSVKKADLLAEKTHPILFDQYWQELNSALKKNLKKTKKKDWHETRKQIKRWLYALNCLEEIRLPPQTLVQAMGKLEKNIGSWHEFGMIKQRLEEKEPADTDPISFRTKFAFAKTRVEEQIERSEKKTEQQLKKVLSLL